MKMNLYKGVYNNHRYIIGYHFSKIPRSYTKYWEYTLSVKVYYI